MTEPTMTALYDLHLSLVQSLNDYGGNLTSIHIRRAVLDAVDCGAGSDISLASIRNFRKNGAVEVCRITKRSARSSKPTMKVYRRYASRTRCRRLKGSRTADDRDEFALVAPPG
jgi:hypothetical protein